MDIKIINIGNRRVCVSGIGKMFYQDGFPISMAISVLAESGIEVSLYHVFDELSRSGGFPITKRGEDRALTAIISSINDRIQGENAGEITEDELTRYSKMNYEDQREEIFQYLFGMPSNDAISDPAKKDKIILSLQ